MTKEQRKGYAMREPGGTGWGSLALPKDLLERIKKAAQEQGISGAFLARKILEGHFPPSK
jgi:hypothetical protein